MPSIDLAIQAAGKPADLVRLLNEVDPKRPVLPQHINNWRKRGVPADRCLAIEMALIGKTDKRGRQVTRYVLLPAVFGKPPADSKDKAA